MATAIAVARKESIEDAVWVVRRETVACPPRRYLRFAVPGTSDALLVGLHNVTDRTALIYADGNGERVLGKKEGERIVRELTVLLLRRLTND